MITLGPVPIQPELISNKLNKITLERQITRKFHTSSLYWEANFHIVAKEIAWRFLPMKTEAVDPCHMTAQIFTPLLLL